MDADDTDDLEVEDQEEELSPGERAHNALCQEIRGRAAECTDTVDIPLLRPVVIAGRTLEELTMRRMRARDILAMQKRKSASGPKAKATTRVDDGMCLLARLADVAPDDLGELDVTDLDLMRAALAGFQGGRPTGT